MGSPENEKIELKKHNECKIKRILKVTLNLKRKNKVVVESPKCLMRKFAKLRKHNRVEQKRNQLEIATQNVNFIT